VAARLLIRPSGIPIRPSRARFVPPRARFVTLWRISLGVEREGFKKRAFRMRSLERHVA